MTREHGGLSCSASTYQGKYLIYTFDCPSFELKLEKLILLEKTHFMSNQARSRETRQTTKQRKALWHSIKQSMSANEEPPVWAKELLTEVTSIKDTLQQRFDELNNSIKEIKKDIRAIVNRVGNTEKQIGILEDKQATHQTAIQECTKEIRNLKTKVTYL